MSPLYIGMIIAGVGLVFVIFGLVMRMRAGKIASTPLAKTGDAARANGVTSCEGAARPQQHQLTAPCTNTPCVFYRIKIEKKVKEKRGTQTSTSWKKLVEQHYGSAFALDDGSGPVTVVAQDDVDGDLEQTFSGAPPGGGGLGVLANFVPSTVRSAPGEEILEYRATEKVIRNDAKLFVMGSAQAGQLTKPGTGKLTVSTKGRAALIGSGKRIALILFLAGGAAAAAGATVAIVRPGEAPMCGMMSDVQTECRVESKTIVDLDSTEGGKPTKIKRRRETLAWHVTKPVAFELAARDPKKRHSAPSIQVENSIGMPMNIDFGLDLGAGSWSTKTKTMKLIPGDYSIYLFSDPDGPSELLLQVTEAPPK